MPTYQFYCDPEDGGCSNIIEFNCLFSEKAENQPKSCNKCKKRKSLRELFGGEVVHIPRTLGSLADKRTAKLSEDEKNHLTIKNNSYRTRGSWVETPDGLKHKSQL